jgi:hypothetical protein
LLPLQAFGNAIASGITYSLLAGLAVMAASEPARLLRAWSRPGRIALSFVLGALLWALLGVALQRFFYFDGDPTDWPPVLLVSAVFAISFALPAAITGRAWVRSAAGVIGVFIAIMLAWQFYNDNGQVIYYVVYNPDVINPLLGSLALGVCMGLLAFVPDALGAIRRANQGNHLS